MSKVTAAKADRVILAIVALTECDDFDKVRASLGLGAVQHKLDEVCNIARAMRDR